MNGAETIDVSAEAPAEGGAGHSAFAEVSKSAPAEPPTTSKNATPTAAKRSSRRTFLKKLVAYSALPAAGGAYSTLVEPFWIQHHELAMPMPKLPAAFEGFRISHLTDLHASHEVPLIYLKRVAREVNALKVDLVVITGDLVTAGDHHVEEAAEAVAAFDGPLLITFGNHDYDVVVPNGRSASSVADLLEEKIVGRTGDRAQVLRNSAAPVEHNGSTIWFVGLEDLWAGRFSPQVAFAGVNFNEPVICLSHNPDTAQTLDSYGADWILCGHTHGGQVRLPFIGAPLLPVTNRSQDQGLFQLRSSKLYVNRGVGYLKQIRFMCRPEAPVFRMTGV